jgi:hypothetical protein
MLKVMGPVPVLARVKLKGVVVVPTACTPKLFDAGVREATGCVPVPVSATV